MGELIRPRVAFVLLVTHVNLEKKFGAHTHFTQHMTTKCCNITTTVNNASTINFIHTKTKHRVFFKALNVLV